MEGPQQTMSRYSLIPIKECTKVDVGYDPWIDSYFFQLRVREGGRNFKIARWLGHGIGDRSVSDGSVESIPEKILEIASQYAEVPVRLLEFLIEDRHPEPKLVPSEPVVYAGLPCGEVWRHRSSVDPVEGLQIVVKPAKRILRERHIAFAVLNDFLGNEYRAKKLAPAFGMLVIRNLPEKRNWLLTEVDVQNGIRDVEAQYGLNWLDRAGGYAGECKLKELYPDKQRDRADHAGRHLDLSEMPNCDLALVAA
jgi:hypothetical protein